MSGGDGGGGGGCCDSSVRQLSICTSLHVFYLSSDTLGHFPAVVVDTESGIFKPKHDLILIVSKCFSVSGPDGTISTVRSQHINHQVSTYLWFCRNVHLLFSD